MLIVPGSVSIELIRGDLRHSVFPCTGENAGDTGWHSWVYSPKEGKLRTTAFVHPTQSACIVLFEGEALPADARLRVSARLLLGHHARDARTVLSWRDSGTGALCARNPGTEQTPHIAALCCHPQPTAWTCDLLSLAQGRYDESAGAGFPPCFAVEVPLKPDGSGGMQAVVVLGSAGQETQLDGIARLASIEQAQALRRQRQVRGDGLVPGASAQAPVTPQERLLEAAARMNEDDTDNKKDGSW